MTAIMTSSDARPKSWLKTDTPKDAFQASIQQLYQGWRRFTIHPLGLLGLGIILLLVATAIAAPWLTPYDPAAQDMMGRLQPPSAAHWLGTDEFGRDVFTRVVYGARTTLYIIMLVTIIVARSA